MKYPIVFFCLAFISISLSAQLQMNLHGSVKFQHVVNNLGEVGNSDCWGWEADDGTEYAIMGTLYGVHFIRVADMAVVDSIEGPALMDGYYHRDIKTYRNYCYVVSEMTGVNEGVMIIDLSDLPDSARFVKSYIDSSRTRSHNLSIDTVNAMAYINDHFYTGVRIVSLADPENLVDIGMVPVPQAHDEYARNDTLWVAEGFIPAYSVWDVSDPGNPVKFASITDPNFGYCHNIWPTDDGKYFLTTEENSFKTVKIWDMTNPSNVTLRGEYLGGNDLAHNVHIRGDSVYIGHYTSGVTVVDISDKDSPIEVAFYDTYPQNDTSDFYGCWGAFPFTSSGYIYASNFEGWFFVLEMVPDTTPASVVNSVPGLRMGSPFPNPLNGFTTIPYNLNASSHIRLEIYDLLGSRIEVLLDEVQKKGTHAVRWNAAIYERGIYFYQLSTDQGEVSGKLILK